MISYIRNILNYTLPSVSSLEKIVSEAITKFTPASPYKRQIPRNAAKYGGYYLLYLLIAAPVIVFSTVLLRVLYSTEQIITVITYVLVTITDVIISPIGLSLFVGGLYLVSSVSYKVPPRKKLSVPPQAEYFEISIGYLLGFAFYPIYYLFIETQIYEYQIFGSNVTPFFGTIGIMILIGWLFKYVYLPFRYHPEEYSRFRSSVSDGPSYMWLLLDANIVLFSIGAVIHELFIGTGIKPLIIIAIILNSPFVARVLARNIWFDVQTQSLPVPRITAWIGITQAAAAVSITYMLLTFSVSLALAGIALIPVLMIINYLSWRLVHTTNMKAPLTDYGYSIVSKDQKTRHNVYEAKRKQRERIYTQYDKIRQLLQSSHVAISLPELDVDNFYKLPRDVHQLSDSKIQSLSIEKQEKFEQLVEEFDTLYDGYDIFLKHGGR